MSFKLSYPPKCIHIKDRYKYFKDQSQQEQERLKCSQCKDMLVEPHQSECGCRFCHCCIIELINKHETFCPGCNSTLKYIEGDLTYDRAVEKEIFELEINCINNECKYKCKLKELRDHLEVCEHREEKCIACGDLYLHKDEEDHKRTCKQIEVLCKDCSIKISRKNFEEKHRNFKGNINELCDHWKSVCPYECIKEVQDSIKVHLKECPEMKVECVLKDVGCTEVLSRKHMDEHVKSWDNHASLMMNEISKLRRENIYIKDKFYNYEMKQKQEIEELKGSINHYTKEIRNLNEKVFFCERKYTDLDKEALVIKRSLVSNGMTSSITDEKVLYGEMTWKIDNIIGKIKDAKMGINVTLFSDPFYSSYGGYKMCLKAYPNGDGNNSGTHFSLYFVIMMGEFDDQLSWPYYQKISLSLLANNTCYKNHTMNMKPDINELCYGKPTKKYNLAAGNPKFISHVELISTREYLKDDAIYIHAKVF